MQSYLFQKEMHSIQMWPNCKKAIVNDTYGSAHLN